MTQGWEEKNGWGVGQDCDCLLPPQATNLIRDSPALSSLASITALQPFYYLVQQTIHWLFMGYSMTAFCLFTWDKWLKVVKTYLHGCQGGQATAPMCLTGFCLSAGVQIHLFPWTRLLLEPTFHIALHLQSNGAKERKVKKEGKKSFLQRRFHIAN